VPTALAAATAGAVALLGAVSLALAGRHASDDPVLLGWSWRYAVGVMLPLAALACGQALAAWRFPALAAAVADRPRRWVAIRAVAVAGAAAWAIAVPSQVAGLLAWLWTANLATLAWAVSRRSGEGLLVLASLALAASGLLAPEFAARLGSERSEGVPRWGDRRTFAFLFPLQEPLIGPGGRLRPSVRTWIARSGLDAERRVWFATNRIGLRNDEEPDTPPLPGGLTVLNLGDSFGIGFGVDQHAFLGPLVQRRLVAALRRPVRVWNAEVSDPCYGALYLQRHGAALRPDIVLFGLSGNDLLQGWLGCGAQGAIRLDADGRLRRVARPAARVRFGQWRQWTYPRDGDPSIAATAAPPRAPHPALQAVLALRSLRALRPPPGPERSDEFRGELTVSGGALVQRGPRKLLFDGFPNLGFAYREELPPAADSWAVSLPLLAAMNRTAQERGARFVLVYLPQRHAVQAQDWSVLARRWNLAASDFDLDRERNRLRAFCEEQRITWVDPSEAFRHAARARNLYLPWDGHFNEAGQALAAKVVAEALERELAQPANAP
jgi:hypothetical protein